MDGTPDGYADGSASIALSKEDRVADTIAETVDLLYGVNQETDRKSVV